MSRSACSAIKETCSWTLTRETRAGQSQSVRSSEKRVMIVEPRDIGSLVGAMTVEGHKTIPA